MYKIRELYKMLTMPLSEFRANTSAMIDLVEQGETVQILRHGKPVAELVPARAGVGAGQKLPSWKRAIQAVQYASGAAPSGAVMQERSGVRR